MRKLQFNNECNVHKGAGFFKQVLIEIYQLLLVWQVPLKPLSLIPNIFLPNITESLFSVFALDYFIGAYFFIEKVAVPLVGNIL